MRRAAPVRWLGGVLFVLLVSAAALVALLTVWPVFGEQPQLKVRAAATPLAVDGVAELPEPLSRQPWLVEWQQQEQAYADMPLIAGNRLELLPDGPPALEAKLQAIADAQHHVHIVIYYFADDPAGRLLADVLLERRSAGVEVRMIYDAFGSFGSEQLLEELAQAGVQLHAFRPVTPFNLLAFWRLNEREHSKLLLIDGREAFTGGMNVSDVYLESALDGGPGEVGSAWRDTHVRLQGPAVAGFQQLFLARWAAAGEAPVHGDGYFPKLAPAGEALVRPVETSEHSHSIYSIYLNAIDQARERLWLTHVYFVPNPAAVQALKAAARRGVDVRLLLPSFSDKPFVLLASQAWYEPLLEAGVRIFERQDAMVHAKTAVADGVWATVGSANFDYRSFLHQREVNAVIVDEAFAAEMEALFEKDLQYARELSLESWRARPLHQRLGEWTAQRFAYWF